MAGEEVVAMTGCGTSPIAIYECTAQRSSGVSIPSSPLQQPTAPFMGHWLDQGRAGR